MRTTLLMTVLGCLCTNAVFGQTATELLEMEPLPPMIMAPSPGLKSLAVNAQKSPHIFAKPDQVPAAIADWRKNSRSVYLSVSGDPKVLGSHSSSVLALGWSPDGKLLASGDERGSIKLWDVVQRSELHNIAASGKPIRNVCFSPSGKLLLAGDGYTKQSQRSFAIAAGKELYMLDYIYLGGLSPTVGKPVGKQLRICDVASGEVLYEIATETPLLRTWFSRSGEEFWTAEVGGSLIAWNVSTGKQRISWNTPQPLLDAVMSANDERIYTLGFSEHLIRVWTREGKEEASLQVGSLAALRRPIGLKISDDGTHLLAETGIALNESARTTQAMRLPFALGTAFGSEALLASVTSDSEVNVWHLPSPKPIFFGPAKSAKLKERGLESIGGK